MFCDLSATIKHAPTMTRRGLKPKQKCMTPKKVTVMMPVPAIAYLNTLGIGARMKRLTIGILTRVLVVVLMRSEKGILARVFIVSM